MLTDDFKDRYLSGRELYGDDFGLDEIVEWFASEREGYSSLDLLDEPLDGETYQYHALNQRQGFRYLDRDFVSSRALGVGSAFGLEFEPLRGRLTDLTILEPSTQLRSTAAAGVPVEYVSPQPSGDMPFASETFDLVLCFGTLHHIPNVSHVVTEIGRVCAPGAYFLVREPIVSMGDWRQFRGSGVTARERGIPIELMRQALMESGFELERESLSGFPVLMHLGRRIGRPTSSSRVLTAIDEALSRATASRYRYHANSAMEKLRPTSAFFVCRKR